MSKSDRTGKPSKPSRDFPLFAHNGGTWAKTIEGRHVHFGPWADPEGARRRWEEFDRARREGRAPRPLADGSMSLKELGDRFLTWQNARARGGQITLRSFRNFRSCVLDFAGKVGSRVTVGGLHPDVFSSYWLGLSQRGLGAESVKKHASIVRQMFRWAYNQDLIDRPMKFGAGPGPAVRRPKRKARLFTGEEVRAAVDAAGVPLKAMILLAVNCGFGQTDVAMLPAEAVDLTAGVIEYPRNKTGIDRRAVLWPETVAAMRAAGAARPKAADPADAGLFFLTIRGTRFVRQSPDAAEGAIKRVSVVDAIAPTFAKVMHRAGIWKLSAKGYPVSDGRNFYTFRRTHRTWSDECRDPHAAALIMGHGFGSIAGLYVQRIGDERLKAIADHLRAKVFKG